METGARINGGLLDTDKDEGNAPDLNIPQSYIEAQDALIEALKNDKGLTVAHINEYMPLVKSTLSKLATAVPGAGTVVAGILNVLPDKI